MTLLLCMLAFGQFDGGSADAGTDAPIIVLDVAHGSLVVREEEDGRVELVPREVGDGCYLPTESCMRVAKQKARKEAELKQENASALKWISIAFGSGAVAGAIAVVVVGLATGVIKVTK